MKVHAMIFKLLGILPREKDILQWIHNKWAPRSHIELRLRANGFFRIFGRSQSDLREQPILHEKCSPLPLILGRILQPWQGIISGITSMDQVLLPPRWFLGTVYPGRNRKWNRKIHENLRDNQVVKICSICSQLRPQEHISPFTRIHRSGLPWFHLDSTPGLRAHSL